MLNVLIFSAATGGGHLRTAQALEQYLTYHVASVQVKVVDAFQEIHYLYDKIVCGGYHFVATKTPALFGRMYHRTNDNSPLSKLVPKINYALGRRLLPLIRRFDPDIIVTTHPFVTEMISYLKGNGLVTAKQLVIMTDYAPHKTWIAKYADGYIVANEDMVNPMAQNLGVEPEKIHSFGIPILQAFFHHRPKQLVRREIGMLPDKTTVLLMAGSFGVKNIMQIYREIVRIPLDFQMIVITGKNQRLYQLLKTTAMLSPKQTKLILFTQKVEQYMQASDLLITKPGGLTVTEALASNLPMLVFDSIPGQEEDNADFLERHGMAKRVRRKESCANALKEILEDERQLASMVQACRDFDRSDGCEKIVALMEQLLKTDGEN